MPAPSLRGDKEPMHKPPAGYLTLPVSSALNRCVPHSCEVGLPNGHQRSRQIYLKANDRIRPAASKLPTMQMSRSTDLCASPQFPRPRHPETEQKEAPH